MDSAVKNINVVCINFTQASVNPYGQPDRKILLFLSLPLGPKLGTPPISLECRFCSCCKLQTAFGLGFFAEFVGWGAPASCIWAPYMICQHSFAIQEPRVFWSCASSDGFPKSSGTGCISGTSDCSGRWRIWLLRPLEGQALEAGCTARRFFHNLCKFSLASLSECQIGCQLNMQVKCK